MRRFLRWAWVAPLALAARLFTPDGMAFVYVDGPPPAVTGGFGEDTCRMCHYDYDLNEAAGGLSLEGVPETYAAGEAYALTVRLTHPRMERGGFQLAARFEAGERAGLQAGSFEAMDARAVVVNGGDAVQYVQHTRAGSTPESGGAIQWTIQWRAPTNAAAPVAFHLAANAANYDDSPLGDFPYATSQVSSVE